MFLSLIRVDFFGFTIFAISCLHFLVSFKYGRELTDISKLTVLKLKNKSENLLTSFDKKNRNA